MTPCILRRLCQCASSQVKQLLQAHHIDWLGATGEPDRLVQPDPEGRRHSKEHH
jgi:hypothetical protein